MQMVPWQKCGRENLSGQWNRGKRDTELRAKSFTTLMLSERAQRFNLPLAQEAGCKLRRKEELAVSSSLVRAVDSRKASG